MASKTILTCDVCGAEAVHTATLTLADETNEVDLCDRHSKAFKVAARPFLSVARTSRGRRIGRPGPSPAAKVSSGEATSARSNPSASTRRSTKKVVGENAATPKTSGRTARTPDANTAEIRAWGQANGFAVGTKGRLSPDVVDAFNAAKRRSK